MEYHIGKLIKGIRTEQKVSQKELAAGLCRTSALSIIESGKQEPGKWLADVLLERLGVSSNKFGCLFTEEEKQEFIYRVELLTLLQAEEMTDWEQYWNEAWEQYQEAAKKGKKAVYQKQFLQYVRLLAEKQMDRENIMDALRMTIPEFNLTRVKKIRFGRVERALAVLLADSFLEQAETRQNGINLYRDILEQMEVQIVDQEELCFQYTLITALVTERLREYGCFGENWINKKALRLLQQERKIYGLSAILHYELERHEIDGENLCRELNPKNISECMKLLGKECGTEKRKDILCAIVMPDFRGSMLEEVIRKRREGLGMTRKQMIQKSGACTERTLLRIEKGEEKPETYVYRTLLQELEQEGCRYASFIWSDNWKLLEKYRKISSFVALGKYKKAGRRLKKLESFVDTRERLNYQAVERVRTVVEGELGRITLEEELDRLKKALHMTVPEEIELAGLPLNQTEIALLNNIANVKEKQKKRNESRKILEAVQQSCRNNTCGVRWNVAGYLLTLYNLARYLGQDGEYENAIIMSEEGLKIGLQSGDGEAVVEFLYKIAWNRERLCGIEERAKTCLPVCQQAFALAEIIRYDRYKKHIRKHCLEEYHIDLLNV